MRKVRLEKNVLGVNEMLAHQNRAEFKNQGLLVINLMSSPGSGKTTLLERTIERLRGRLCIGVIEGDLYTDLDAQRLESHGVPVVQINTKGACHLDAGMVGRAYKALKGQPLDVVFIENVGNLVCPAEFDLGEDLRAVVVSVTEGHDKIAKYPAIFLDAAAVIVNKIDLLAYTDFSFEKFIDCVRSINPQAPIFKVSGRTGAGIQEWCEWVANEVLKKRA